MDGKVETGTIRSKYVHHERQAAGKKGKKGLHCSFIHSFKGCCIIHYNHMNNTELLFSLRLHSGAGKQLVFKSEKKKM